MWFFNEKDTVAVIVVFFRDNRPAYRASMFSVEPSTNALATENVRAFQLKKIEK